MWIGASQLRKHGGDYLASREAAAATAVPREPIELAHAELAVAPRPKVESVFGAPDAELLAPIGAAKVTRVKLNLGGTSLSLRLDFANGARAAFKPEQEHYQSDPRR